MHTSNNAGLNPMGFGMQQRYLGMSTGGINVNPTTNQNGLMRTLGNTGMKINQTNQTTSYSQSAPSRQPAPSRQSAPSSQSAPSMSMTQVDNKVKQPKDLVANSAPIHDFLEEHTLTIKYKKGDEIVPRLKKNLKADKLHKKVKFRSDKKLKWSPQYHLDGELTDLRGYMNNELLYINLIEQIDAWRESSESSGFDDKTDSEAEDSAEEDNSGDEEVVANEDNSGEEEVVANEDNSGDEEVVANEDNSGDDEVVANEDNSGDDEDHSDDE